MTGRCRHSAAHPEPVVLVHGAGGNKQTNCATCAPLLANEGYCVYALTYGAYDDLPWPLSALGAFRPMDESAQQLADFVDRVPASTGAKKVNLVGHSQGALMPTYSGITYTNIITRYDQLVMPHMSGYEEGPNTTNIVVQDHRAQDFGEHLSIAGEPVAATLVLNALDPANPRPVPCEAVLPLVG